ncbi:MAG TPA: hypothetical protein VGV64_04340 [Thermoplasmata archaeon]|nr:hypothetical protein [Thermoplasmata archaeon]HEV2429062.1 hypothetical protein [Thermoplasmata archaeon]
MARFRRASGGREEGLLKRAEALRRSTEPLLPDLTKGCPREPFDRLKEELEEVRGWKDDTKRLDHYTRWGDPFPRAYAGFLRFYLEPELPPLLPVRLGGAEVAYAPLARAPPEFQIAVQQHDDPRKLILGYLGLAKKGFYFYALPERLLCTGKESNPPGEFLRKQDEDLPYRFEHSTGDSASFLCPHLNHHDPVPWIGVEWTSAGRSFRICGRCAKEDAQLLGALAAGIAQPKAEDAFAVSADLNVDCRGGPDCPHKNLPEVSRSLMHRYLAGRIADKEFVQEYVRETEPYVGRTGRTLRVAAGVCYGDDTAAFIDALHPNGVERTALTEVLPPVRGLFEIPDATASQALERLWKDHAEEIVAAIESDPAEARRIVQEARAAPGRVSELLRRAAQHADERAKLSALPTYSQMSPEAAFVDSVARTFRVGGIEAAERRVEQTLPREGKERGLAWGLLVALGRAGPHGWQFSDTERRFGETLADHARSLLEGPPEGYGPALSQLLQAAGVAGPLR